MATYDLTNQPISSSFQGLLQIDSGSFLRDGTGSIVDNINTTSSNAISSSYSLTASFAENVVDPTWDEIQNKPSGIVSSSSQIDLAQTFGTASHAISASYAVSASYEIVKEVSSSYADTVPFTGILNPPTLVSGSSQINYPDISNIPSGIVSSSAQVSDLTGSSLVNSVSDFSEITFTRGDGTTFQVAVTPRQVIESVKNGNGQTLFKGTPVYASGSVGNAQLVFPASASDDTTMPAVYILAQDLNAGEEGFGYTHGFINGVDTSLFSAGDEVYVGENGGFTNQRPTGSLLIQKLGTVVRSDDNNGSGVIQIDSIVSVPNIQEGYVWVGDSNGVAQPTPTSSIQTDTSDLVTTSSFNAYTSSTDARLDSIEVTTSSLDTRVTNLENFSSSLDNDFVSETEFGIYTQSNDSKVQSLIDETGSYATTGSNNFFGNQDISGSVSSTINQSNTHLNPQIIIDDVIIPTGQNGLIIGEVSIGGDYIIEGNSEVKVFTEPDLDGYLLTSTYEVDSASFDSRFSGKLDTSTYETDSSSFDTRIDGKLDTSTYEVDSASFDNRINTITIDTSSLATTGSNTFNGNQSITGSVEVSGSGLFTDGLEVGTGPFSANLGVSGQIILRSGSGISTDGAFGPAVPFDSPVQFFKGISFNDSSGPSGAGNASFISFTQQSSLDSGPLGNPGLVVSGSNLYFYNGSTWTQIN